MRIPVQFIVLLVLFFLLTIVKSEKSKQSGDVETTTEKSELLSSLNRITSKVQAIKDRLSTTLNHTADTFHDFAIEEGYKYVSKLGYYKLYPQKLSWQEALRFCEKVKARFATISSSNEKNVLEKVVEEKFKSLDPERVAFVGIHDYGKGSWINIFFDVLNDVEYIKWKPTETTANFGSLGGPKCAAMNSNGYLISLPCASKQAFICKRDIIPNSKYD